MKKQAYMKPAMRVVKIQQQHIICASPDNLDGQSLQMYDGDDYQIESEENVW